MPEGTVTGRKVSKKGTPIVVVDGQDYYAGTTDVSKVQIGDRISFDSSEFAPGRWGLQAWKLLQAVSKYPSSTPPSQEIPAPRPLQQAQGGITEAERIFAYGVVTFAIQAGLIKEPEQIEKWVCAGKNALRSQGE